MGKKSLFLSIIGSGTNRLLGENQEFIPDQAGGIELARKQSFLLQRHRLRVNREK